MMIMIRDRQNGIGIWVSSQGLGQASVFKPAHLFGCEIQFAVYSDFYVKLSYFTVVRNV